MTKLFSMKSLAFAGAAAFALTLAAAPQADAAEANANKFEMDFKDLSKATIKSDTKELTKNADGTVIYYQVVKDASATIKENKYVAIANENLEDKDKHPYYNFSSLSGKGKYLVISTDGKEVATGVAIKKAPKVKIKNEATGISLSIDGTKADLYGADGKVTTQGAVYAKVGDVKYNITGMEPDTVKSASVLGATLSVKVKEEGMTSGVPAETTAKYKVSGKPKAPKVSLKLDATKAFEWKLNAKQEYMISVDGDDSQKWEPGSGSGANWASIVEKAISKDRADKVVSGDAILADITLSVRTAAPTNGKKPASAINVTKLSKSIASPTNAAVITITKASGKKATGASIEAKADLQYSDDNGAKWKKLANGKKVNLKSTQTSILIRTPGKSKNGMVLPSLNTKFEWNKDTGKGVLSNLKYENETEPKFEGKNKIVIETENVEAK